MLRRYRCRIAFQNKPIVKFVLAVDITLMALMDLTRGERLKSALYLRLKKRKAFKIVREGDPLGVFKLQFALLQNIEKLEGGTSGDKKIEKKSHSAEKFR